MKTLKKMKNNEYGSDFHYPIKKRFLLDENIQSIFSSDAFSFFFSGRVALYNILKNGIENANWKKVYVPSFYCHEVVHFIESLPIPIHYYEFNPFLDSEDKKLNIEDINTTAIVNVSFFGLKKIDLKGFKDLIQIDDVTHNILGYRTSTADFCFGSLRKELPVPVGGFCFSPQNEPLPNALYNHDAENVAFQKLTAMFFKKQYLKGKWKDKKSFRTLYAASEEAFELDNTNASLPEIAKKVLFQLDSIEILEKKNANVKKALELLENQDSISFNLNDKSENVFGLLVECKTPIQQKEFKDYLVKNNIFPAVLWPNQISERDREVEQRILFIHLDFRYNTKAIKKIIKIINAFSKHE